MAADTAPHVHAGRALERAESPPVVVFLPGILEAEHNTSLRLAELIAADLTEGPGTFAVEPVPADGTPKGATDRYRVIRVGEGPIMDLCTADYRPGLRRRSVAGDGLFAGMNQLAWALWYFVRSARLVYGARRRAKSRLARAQLVLGFGAAALLFLGVLATGYTVGVALGLWDELVTTSERIEDAIAVGMTAAATWLLVKGRPKLTMATDLLRQVLDYAEQTQVSAGTTKRLVDVIDGLLEQDGNRRIHVLGYSFGSLVALDVLIPKDAAQRRRDERYPGALRSLTTVGCPAEFMELYFPDHLQHRTAVAPQMMWNNIFIPADVFGSNFHQADDSSDAPGHAVGGLVPKNYRYAEAVLSFGSVLTGQGFATHGRYWKGEDLGHCLARVHQAVLA